MELISYFLIGYGIFSLIVGVITSVLALRLCVGPSKLDDFVVERDQWPKIARIRYMLKARSGLSKAVVLLLIAVTFTIYMAITWPFAFIQ